MNRALAAFLAVARGILVEDGGLVSIGPAGEREYGRRNFMEVTSMFLTEPLLPRHMHGPG